MQITIDDIEKTAREHPTHVGNVQVRGIWLTVTYRKGVYAYHWGKNHNLTREGASLILEGA